VTEMSWFLPGTAQPTFSRHRLNPRKEESHIDDLRKSVRENGVVPGVRGEPVGLELPDTLNPGIGLITAGGLSFSDRSKT
jgi:hypothetical protein